jgi:hypothetical protein
MKTHLSVLAAIACLVGTMSPAHAEWGGTATHARSALDASTVGVAGTVVDGSARPLGGARVTASFFDDDSHEAVQTPIVVGSATTDVEGTFRVRTRAAKAIVAAADRNGGTVPLDVVVQRGDLSTVVVVTDAVTDATRTSSGRVAGSSEGITVVLDAASPGTERISLVAAEAVPHAPVPPPCRVVRRLISTDSAYARVGELHLTQDETGTFTYGERADTTVQVKVQLTAGGPWTAGGGVEIGNSRQSSVTWRKPSSNGRVLSTAFTFKKYKVDHGPPGICDRGDYWQIRATQWEGGAGLEEYVHGFDNHCDDAFRENARHFAPGVSYSTGTQQAIKWSFGVLVFGIGLSTTSGFSQWVTHTWRFGDNWRWYHLCGPGNVPNVAARIFSGPATNGSPFDA